MNKKIIKYAKIILPLLLGVFFIAYSYYNTSEEDRHKIYTSIKNADYFWVFLSLVMGGLSHLSRAYRWNFLLAPMGYRPRYPNNLMAVAIAYLANLGVPRSGEVLRATTLASYENVPFQKAFGTIVAERVVDLFMLFLIVLLAFIFQTETILGFFIERGFNLNILLLFIGIGLFCLFIFIRFIKRSKASFAIKIKKFIKGLLEGATSIFKMKRRGLFAFHTFFIWTMYVLMFWVIRYSMPETQNLPFSAIITAFIAGTFAISTTNGGVGLYPIAVGKILVIYGISQTAADAFGWIMWTSQTLLVVFIGALSFLFLPIYNRSK
ncbi:lysylphosphatidylglycerol synthase transmembrane domain-containing protein [Leptobacterium sp. I13]|uniref:lysylphosphatidylglycerol synthase transmembrane domain-containing protein n=1 Tax=Leptobacterium meishanense TaxID=3128904 RepID=UPI0030EC4C8D